MTHHRIICGKAEDVLPEFEDNSFDLIATDPPYNIGKDFENDNLPEKDYLGLWGKWAKELNRVLDVGGALYLTIGWQYVAELKVLFKEINDLRLKNWIIWYRQDGWKGDNGFAHSHEHILYYIKDNTPLFDLEDFGEHIKRKRLEAGYETISALMEEMGLYKKTKRSDGSEDYWSGVGWFESGKKQPSLQELIRVNQLLDLNVKYHPSSYLKDAKIDPEKVNVFFNKVDVSDDVWLTPKSEKKRLGHPTQKPVPLFERIIKASSAKGDLILDPFMGTGTALVAAERLGRSSVGIDISKENCEMVYKRVKKEMEQERLFDKLVIEPRGPSSIEKEGF